MEEVEDVVCPKEGKGDAEQDAAGEDEVFHWKTSNDRWQRVYDSPPAVRDGEWQ